ncbi:hypothetical protein H5202_01205 [Shewanella sp. SG41-4]|uniref:hypothetical protein n=1 Tax=Shewanella sp. SG41-4 TaxID=2760976 RepID=UPI001601D855|nr:hypothetical protein [Shewanella sp. SG41-4]MBB1437302.1 hypothetical protein [Shewanella sp. SG41-4]
MKYLSIVIIALLLGCSSQDFSAQVNDEFIEKVIGGEYSRNGARCKTIKNQCPDGQYEEWIQKSGEKACACNSL